VKVGVVKQVRKPWGHENGQVLQRPGYYEIGHPPSWVPADLRINTAGDTRPGFICDHQLENGNGPCGGTTFDVDWWSRNWHWCCSPGKHQWLLRGLLVRKGRPKPNTRRWR
jgi:hypothetical protein